MTGRRSVEQGTKRFRCVSWAEAGGNPDLGRSPPQNGLLTDFSWAAVVAPVNIFS
jgi:hypothetical protein